MDISNVKSAASRRAWAIPTASSSPIAAYPFPTVSSASTEQNAAVMDRASRLASEGVELDFVTHERLKELSRQAKGVIRTGEATPFANATLYSGVIFGPGRR
jgi:hypothetical protein